jgi:hypothetical protein
MERISFGERRPFAAIASLKEGLLEASNMPDVPHSGTTKGRHQSVPALLASW